MFSVFDEGAENWTDEGVESWTEEILPVFSPLCFFRCPLRLNDFGHCLHLSLFSVFDTFSMCVNAA